MKNQNLLLLIIVGIIFFPQKINAQKEGQELTIIHTNDIQSRLLGFAPNADYTPQTTNDDETVGGIARVATVIRNIRAEAPDQTLVLDGGDWMMGTLFQTISTFVGAELQLMQAIGYDATVIGNHEFDFRCDGLADIIEAAQRSGKIPPIVLSNGIFDQAKKEDDRLEVLFENGTIKKHLIFEKNGLRIGIFGVMGIQAADVAPYAKPMTFADPIKTAKEETIYLRKEENVDVVICLTHSGVWHEGEITEWGGEDVALAKAVSDIDLIVSGHSHTPLSEPIIVNGTPIVQAGSEGQFVGVMKMKFKENKLQIVDYELVTIDDSYVGAEDITAMVDSFKLIIDEKVLQNYNVQFKDTLAETNFDLTISDADLASSNVSAFAADALRWGTQKYDSNEEYPTIAIITAGLIRDQLKKGATGLQQASDLFRILPLGIGTLDDSPGYPLTKAYVTPRELKAILEILLIAPSLKGNSHFPIFSGLRFKYNPNRMPLDQVFEIELGDEKNGYTLLNIFEENTLIGIGVNAYIYESIGLIDEISKGILSVSPKDVNGNPINSPADVLLDKSKTTPGIQEVKEWGVLLDFFQQFPDVNGNGIADLPDSYKNVAPRMVAVPSWNPKLLYTNSTKVMWGTTFVCVLLLFFAYWLGKRIARIF